MLTYGSAMRGPDLEWVPAGPAAVERTVFRGHDEVANGFAAIWQTWEVFHFEEGQFRDLGDSVLWLGRVKSLRKRKPHSTSTRSSPFTFGCKTVRSSPFALS